MEPGERVGSTPTLPCCGGAGPLGQGDSGPSHAQLCMAVPGTSVPGRPRSRASTPGILELAALRGAVVNFIGLWLVGEQKQKTALEGMWKLLSRAGEFPAWH